MQQKITEEVVVYHEEKNEINEDVQNETAVTETETTSPIETSEPSELVNEEQPLESEPTEPSELFEESNLVVEFDLDEELTIEIPEVVDEGLLIIERDPPIFDFTEPATNLVELAQPAMEIEEEIKQAALLWAEQWGADNEEILYEVPEQAIEETVTIIDILPIEPAELAEKLENIPEERLQEAAAILDIVLESVQNYEKQETIEPAELEIITKNLEQIVERLLVCLEIEHDEKHVAAIVQALLSGEIKLDFDDVLARQDEGTHERKYVSTWIMAVLKQRTNTKPVDHSFIGKYVIQLSFLETLTWAA